MHTCIHVCLFVCLIPKIRIRISLYGLPIVVRQVLLSSPSSSSSSPRIEKSLYPVVFLTLVLKTLSTVSFSSCHSPGIRVFVRGASLILFFFLLTMGGGFA